MGWQLEMTEIIRCMINDLDETPKYEDERLERILLVASFQVNIEGDFLNDYIVDIQTSTLTPDPTSDTYRDDSFVNLACMKAACILDRGTAVQAADLAISSKEWSSSLDLRGVADARYKILLKGGWCSTYEVALMDHAVNSNQVAGAAILSPFRTIAGYPGFSNSNIYYV